MVKRGLGLWVRLDRNWLLLEAEMEDWMMERYGTVALHPDDETLLGRRRRALKLSDE